jgi:hypothetical protein
MVIILVIFKSYFIIFFYCMAIGNKNCGKNYQKTQKEDGECKINERANYE